MTDIKDRPVLKQGVAFNRWGPLLGIGFIVFIVASIATGNTPDPSASGIKVIDYYTKHRDLTVVSISTDLVGIVCGTFFFGYLYAWLRRSDWGWIPVVMVMGASLFMVAGLLAGGTDTMLVDQGRHISPDTAKALNVVADDLWNLVGAAGIGITALATGISLLGHRVASRWWAIAAIAVGVIAIVGWFTPFGLLLEAIWVLAFSIRLLVRRESVNLANSNAR